VLFDGTKAVRKLQKHLVERHIKFYPKPEKGIASLKIAVILVAGKEQPPYSKAFPCFLNRSSVTYNL